MELDLHYTCDLPGECSEKLSGYCANCTREDTCSKCNSYLCLKRTREVFCNGEAIGCTKCLTCEECGKMILGERIEVSGSYDNYQLCSIKCYVKYCEIDSCCNQLGSYNISHDDSVVLKEKENLSCSECCRDICDGCSRDVICGKCSTHKDKRIDKINRLTRNH